MSKHHFWRRVLLLLMGFACLPVDAGDDRRSFGSMQPHDYGTRGYYGPRPQPVYPTRPFFVQPYPRGGYRSGDHAYRHGYRDGYYDGYDDRDDRGGRHGYRDRGDRWDTPGRYGPDSFYRPHGGDHGGRPGYGRAYNGGSRGGSLYYRNR